MPHQLIDVHLTSDGDAVEVRIALRTARWRTHTRPKKRLRCSKTVSAQRAELAIHDPAPAVRCRRVTAGVHNRTDSDRGICHFGFLTPAV
jgi:hypothetical protein